mmetsp:Transcript_13561/g.25492  ORF Transcript_13561/g.25492 Transcript_13561/m.25492 type:complete len:102 (-) Transcript_13561:39-344(-)
MKRNKTIEKMISHTTIIHGTRRNEAAPNHNDTFALLAVHFLLMFLLFFLLLVVAAPGVETTMYMGTYIQASFYRSWLSCASTYFCIAVQEAIYTTSTKFAT